MGKVLVKVLALCLDNVMLVYYFLTYLRERFV